AWYLVGRVDGDARTYRIARMLDLEVLDRRFERPEPFDLAAYWQISTQRLEADLHRSQATVRLSPWGVKMLEAFTSPYVRAATRVSTEVDADGWHTAVVPVGSIRQACVELLRFGADGEVLEPPELRAKMAAVIADMAALYAR
ncbi:MAG: transcriptional regulator, partial [Gammaproteobacteria bacterium]|nr:transcriptional regulator [Gammaproteobacteria bacterium]